MKNLSPAFLTAIALSLAGFANLGFAERYVTLKVQSDNTANMAHSAAVSYLQSNALLSPESLEVAEGEVAHVFSSTANKRVGASKSYSYEIKGAFVQVVASINGLDQNNTLGNWNPHISSWGSNIAISNSNNSVQPIPGPATIRIRLKPSSCRPYNNTSYDNWAHSGQGEWDFEKSEGFITFRIAGAQQEVSKKFATVIPENSSGNVDIILEQSTDLINWSAVNPGSFPPSTAKRFFRVRSQE